MTTYLRVGRGRWPSKPPKGNPSPVACQVPIDGGFEQELAQTGGGPGGDEIPHMVTATATQLVWTDDTVASAYGWMGQRQTYTGFDPWRVKTTEPRNGTFHAEHAVPAVTGLHSGSLFGHCTQAPSGVYYSGPVTPGQEVSVSGWMLCDPSGVARAGVEFRDASDGFLGGFSSSDVALGTSYELVSHSVAAPANAAYYRAFFQGFNSASVARTYRLDDADWSIA